MQSHLARRYTVRSANLGFTLVSPLCCNMVPTYLALRCVILRGQELIKLGEESVIVIGDLQIGCGHVPVLREQHLERVERITCNLKRMLLQTNKR